MLRTAVVAIIKNEGAYLREWIAHCLAIGFDHIYLYDNDSTDETMRILEKQRVCKYVTTTSWPSANRSNPQASAYRHFLETYRGSVEWAMPLDLDEFLNLKTHKNLAAFLDSFGYAHSIGINWRLFGDSGHRKYEPGMVTERFTMASEANFGPNHIPKSISKLSVVEELGTHTPRLKPGHQFINTAGELLKQLPAARQDKVNLEVAQVNHYFGKSYEEWSVKRKRGVADRALTDLARTRDDGQFGFHNRNDVHDDSIQRFSSCVKMILSELFEAI